MTPLPKPPFRRAQTPRRVAPAQIALLSFLFFAAPFADADVGAAEPALPTADIVPDAPAKATAPSDDPAAQASLPGCAAWTDRCVTCEREPGGGRISCSNIGIACQPQALECIRSEAAEEKKPDGDGKNEN